MANSRKELIGWLNGLGIEIDKIEELGKGTAICRLLSQIHPSFPQSFISNPSNEYEYLKNMKIIQGFFIQNKIEMFFPIDRLIKCKLQDNLEVVQKLYKHWVTRNTQKGEQTRDTPREVSQREVHGKDIQQGSGCTQKEGNIVAPRDESVSIGNIGFNCTDRSTARKEIIENLNQTKKQFQVADKKRIEELEEENLKLKEEVLQKTQEILKFKAVMGELGSVKEVLKALEVNRDFYFEKLVEIEKVLVESVDVPEAFKNILFEILYRKQE